MRVKVGGSLSTPRHITKGVPQGSVLSPFLFNIVLANIPNIIPRSLLYQVRVSIYADDIALYCSGPTLSGRTVRAQLQHALECVGEYLSTVGLSLSTSKTEALVLHPRPAAWKLIPNLQLKGVPLPWKKSARYLGLVIDAQLTWRPAVAKLRKEARQVADVANRLQAKGEGCSPELAYRFYNGIAVPKLLYALPLVDLRPSLWRAIDVDQRAAIRRFMRLPRWSQVPATYAEAATWPISLRAQLTALNTVERMQRAPGTSQLLSRLSEARHSHMGRAAQLFGAHIARPPSSCSPALPPHLRAPLSIQTVIPGVRSKKDTPVCALQQETAALLHEDCSGRVEIYTDGSVLEGGASAAAACVVPSLGIARQSRLTCSASSTTAEVAALHLAADLILETPDLSPAVVLSDSKAALTTLRSSHHTLPMYANLDNKLRQARALGRDVLLQWLPSHVGISGNEQADQLAKQAHADGTPECTAISPLDVARHNIKARIVA
ncbi:uncharacterized protein LOC144103311 [Amblyomma americanum]